MAIGLMHEPPPGGHDVVQWTKPALQAHWLFWQISPPEHV
jgi:hypothetical protein